MRREEVKRTLIALVRTRKELQKSRTRMFNRLGLRKNGECQKNLSPRSLTSTDLMMREDAKALMEKEKIYDKEIAKLLKRFPIWNEWLKDVKGIGPAIGAILIAEIDIRRAVTVSALWQFCGLNPGLVRGKKVVEKGKYKLEMGEIIGEFVDRKNMAKYVVLTDELIRGDKMTKGFVRPYNARLKACLIGVLASRFLGGKKRGNQSRYATEFYYPYKSRLENSSNKVIHLGKEKEWREVTKKHRHYAAMRYMIKMFLKDLYVNWRGLEGLEIRPSYQEEYLGKKTLTNNTASQVVGDTQVIRASQRSGDTQRVGASHRNLSV